MEAQMVRRADRPLLQVRVSFETTRFSQQHLIEVYARLVPSPRRGRVRPPNEGVTQPLPGPTAKRGSGGRP